MPFFVPRRMVNGGSRCLQTDFMLHGLFWLWCWHCWVQMLLFLQQLLNMWMQTPLFLQWGWYPGMQIARFSNEFGILWYRNLCFCNGSSVPCWLWQVVFPIMEFLELSDPSQHVRFSWKIAATNRSNPGFVVSLRWKAKTWVYRSCLARILDMGIPSWFWHSWAQMVFRFNGFLICWCTIPVVVLRFLTCGCRYHCCYCDFLICGCGYRRFCNDSDINDCCRYTDFFMCRCSSFYNVSDILECRFGYFNNKFGFKWCRYYPFSNESGFLCWLSHIVLPILEL